MKLHRHIYQAHPPRKDALPMVIFRSRHSLPWPRQQTRDITELFSLAVRLLQARNLPFWIDILSISIGGSLMAFGSIGLLRNLDDSWALLATVGGVAVVFIGLAASYRLRRFG